MCPVIRRITLTLRVQFVEEELVLGMSDQCAVNEGQFVECVHLMQASCQQGLCCDTLALWIIAFDALRDHILYPSLYCCLQTQRLTRAPQCQDQCLDG